MTEPQSWTPQGTPTPPPPPYGPEYGQYPLPGPPAPPVRATNWWAIISLAFGVLGGVLISVVCGIVGLRKAKDGRGGKGLAIAGLVLSGVWVLVAVAAFGFLALDKSASGGNGQVEATAVKVGDCLTEIPSDAGLVSSVHTVGCTEPHKGEVYSVITASGDDFPGEQAITNLQDRCQPMLERLAPAAMEDPEVGMYVLYPTEESWKRGDREVTCIATTESPRTSPLQRQ